jgi:hypothetical protein
MEEGVKPHYEGRLRITHSKEGDVLYISIGQPREAVTMAHSDGLLVRRDPKTQEIVGATITDYEEHFRKLHDVSWLFAIHLPSDLRDFVQRRPSLRNS